MTFATIKVRIKPAGSSNYYIGIAILRGRHRIQPSGFNTHHMPVCFRSQDLRASNKRAICFKVSIWHRVSPRLTTIAPLTRSRR